MRHFTLALLLLVASAVAQEPAKPRLNLTGDRFPGLSYEELTPAQKVIADRALAGRGAIGIFNITLRSPELSDAMRGIAGSRTAPQAAGEKLSEKGIVDIIGLVGFYQTVSLMMNVDRFPLTSAQKPELQPLARPLPLSSSVQSANPPPGERFKPLTTEEMTPPQKALMDLLVSGKIEGGTRGPLNVLLRSPDLGEGILRYGAYERFHAPLPAKLNELTALITIRHWTTQFPWYAHHRAATQAGLSEAVISAIAEGKRPAGLQPDEQAVYNFCAELLRTTQMSDATFNAAKLQLGERGVVEIMGVMGYYQTVAMLLNTDRYALPDGVAPELKPLP
jgi:4-carboxymuconolactone decarboxylase